VYTLLNLIALTDGEPRRSSRFKESKVPPQAKKAPAKRGAKKAAAKLKGTQEEETAGDVKSIHRSLA
jgi:hypothetical protein